MKIVIDLKYATKYEGIFGSPVIEKPEKNNYTENFWDELLHSIKQLEGIKIPRAELATENHDDKDQRVRITIFNNE